MENRPTARRRARHEKAPRREDGYQTPTSVRLNLVFDPAHFRISVLVHLHYQAQKTEEQVGLPCNLLLSRKNEDATFAYTLTQPLNFTVPKPYNESKSYPYTYKFFGEKFPNSQ